MANKDYPRGFRPKGAVKKEITMESGSACYPGDFVKLASDGQVDPVSAGDAIFGLCLSYASASGQKVSISCDPDQVYIGQCDSTHLDVQSDVGNVADLTATAGSSTYKTSRQEIDSSSIASGGTKQVTILSLNREVGNAFGEFAEVEFKINEHQVFGDEDFAGI